MRKVASAITASYLLLNTFATKALADVAVNVPPPSAGVNPSANVGKVISNALTIAYAIGALIVLVYLIMGAFNWITSGGDKEKVKNARGTIVHALIGLAILALAALVLTVVSNILGFANPLNFTIPSLGTGAS